MSRHDRQRLTDIITAIEATRAHLRCGEPSAGLVFDAVRIRLLKIGEAVNAIGGGLLASEPSVAWRQIVAMRNRLAHRYIDTSHAIVTATVRHDLDVFAAKLNGRPRETLGWMTAPQKLNEVSR